MPVRQMNTPTIEESHSFSKSCKDNKDSSYTQFDVRGGKLEFPKFAGDDPTEWINLVGQYFECQETPHDQKVQKAVYIEGEANQ